MIKSGRYNSSTSFKDEQHSANNQLEYGNYSSSPTTDSRMKYDWYSPFSMQHFYSSPRSSVYFPYQYSSFVFQNYSNNFNINSLNPDTWGQSQQMYGYQYFDASTSPMVPFSRFFGNEYNEDTHGNYEQSTQNPRMPFHYTGPIITTYGTINVLLRHCIRVDITVNKAIRLINFPGGCTAALNSLGNSSCISHPTGKMLQEGVTVHMKTGNRLAKISKRGITFTSLEHSLVYLVDASGTKSTVEHFQDLSYDFSLDVFYSNSLHGEEAINECFMTLSRATHRFNRNGDEVWTIGGVCIKQTPWGDVRVSRDYGRRVLRTSPTQGTMSVSTPFIYMAAGCDPDRYFFVQRGEKRLSAHVGGFKVKNGSQKAGFDSKGRLVLS